MRIDILLVKHPQPKANAVMPPMIQILEDAGIEVQARYPDEPGSAAQIPAPDEVALCVLKAKTPAALELARRYHEAGVRTFNPYPTTELCRDKVATTRLLADAGVPVPQTWLVDDVASLVPLLDDGPLIVKPLRGSQGQGVQVVEDEAAVRTIDADGDTLMAQRYMTPDGLDRKIYRIGDEVFCIERVWPPMTDQDKLGRVISLPAEHEQIARRCGDALGIDTYGVDIIEHRGRPYVVDLSSLPGFKGVPDAPRRLADRVLAAARP